MKLSPRTVIVALAVVVLIAAAVVLVPRLTHACDNCGDFFVGTGYEANVISDAITTITGQQDKILCEDCAIKEHALEIAAGKSVEDFKRPLFGDKE